jgi:hypothetical protein
MKITLTPIFGAMSPNIYEGTRGTKRYDAVDREDALQNFLDYCHRNNPSYRETTYRSLVAGDLIKLHVDGEIEPEYYIITSGGPMHISDLVVKEWYSGTERGRNIISARMTDAS